MATFKGLGFDGTNARTRTGTANDTIQFAGSVTIDKNAIIDGNLNVAGTIVSTDEQQVLVQDNFLDLNFGYITNSYEQSGLTFNYNATTTGVSINTTSNTMTFADGDGSTTRAQISVATTSAIPAATFVNGDIIQVNGTTNGDNDGIYVVHSQASAGVIILKSSNLATPDTVNAAFARLALDAETESTATVTIFKCDLMALRSSNAGALQQAAGNSDSDFATYTTIGGTQTLQDTYDNGAVITTSGGTALDFNLANGNFTIDQGSLILGASTATNLTVDGGSTTFGQTTALTTFDLASAAVGIDANGAAADVLYLNAGDSAGTISIQSQGSNIAEFKNSSVEFFERLNGGNFGRLYRVPTAAADDFLIQLEGASSLDASLWLESNGSGADALLIQTVTNGGGIDINSVGAVTVDAVSASNFTVTGANLTLSTATSGDLNLTAAGNIVASGTFQADGTNGFQFGGAGQNVTSVSTATDLGGGSAADTALATQLAIKTYVDAQVTAQDLDFAGDSGTGAVDLDSQSLTIAGGTNLTSSASGQTLTVALDSTITLTEVNATNIDASNLRANDGTAAITIADTTGAVAVSKATTFSADTTITGQNSIVIDATNGAILSVENDLSLLSGVNQYDLVYISGTGYQQADASASSTAFVVGISAEDASGGAVSNGRVIFHGAGVVDIPTGTPAVGDRVYLSETAGKATLTAPTTAGSVVYQVGFVTNATAISGTIFTIVFQPQFIIEN